MGYPTVGYEGALTSWASTNNTALLANMKPYSATFNIPEGVADRTPFAPTDNTAQFGGGLREWSGTIRGRYASTPLVGYLGNIAHSGGDILYVEKWALQISALVHKFTGLQSTATLAGWESFRPGLIEWKGSYDGFLDSATTPVLPQTPQTAAAAATLTLTTSNTFAGTILVNNLTLASSPRDLNKKGISFMGSSTLTAAGSANLFAAGAVTTPEWDTTGDGVSDSTMVFTLSSGRTLTGAAFWTEISVTVDPKAFTEITVNFRGSGALTPA